MSELLSPEDYLAQVLATLTPLAATDTPLTQAHGLILAQDVVAALSVPPWTNSGMDGYGPGTPTPPRRTHPSSCPWPRTSRPEPPPPPWPREPPRES